VEADLEKNLIVIEIPVVTREIVLKGGRVVVADSHHPEKIDDFSKAKKPCAFH